MTALLFVIPWLAASVLAGYYLGVSTRAGKEFKAAVKERDAALRVLNELSSATDQMTSDVNHHSSEIRDVGETLNHMEVGDEFEGVQSTLLRQVASVLEANQRLEDDLTCTRLEMEKQAQEIDRARKEARTDALSGAANRMAFDERLKVLLAMWRRHQYSFFLMLADIDHFKWINDSHGHQAGDLVVQRIGETLRGCVREEDFVARYGGDEFALLITNTDREGAMELTERIRQRVSACNFDLGPGTEKVAVTFSIGLAGVWEGATPEEMLHRADQALYRSKEAGRNKVHCYQDGGECLAVTEEV